MSDRALIAVCAGCCCGHPESGGPKTPPRTLKPAIRRRLKAATLDGARVAFTDCLGPCSEANVLFLYLDGQPRWLRRMNNESLYDVFFAWLRDALSNGTALKLPSVLEARSFTWTGGGEGPAPPIEDSGV
jgi:(2Fe-2S) ferredoxin